jgi:hypothetical protein
MLMVHEDGGHAFAMPLPHQQESRDRVTVASLVRDAPSLERGSDIDGDDFHLDSGCGRPEPEPMAKFLSKDGGVIHDVILD